MAAIEASSPDAGRLYDELLVTLVQTGDRRAGERLAIRWQPRLARTARRLLGDDEADRAEVRLKPLLGQGEEVSWAVAEIAAIVDVLRTP